MCPVNGNVRIVTGYYANGARAWRIVNQYDQSIMVATVALDDVPPEGHVHIKNWSENDGIFEALVGAGIIADTGIVIQLNHVQVHLAKVLVDELI